MDWSILIYIFNEKHTQMKKHLLLIATVILVFNLSAQVTRPTDKAEKNRYSSEEKIKIGTGINQKAPGDTLWQNNFSTVSDWTVTSGTGHTAGSWSIVNAMPTSLTSQIPTYGFPGAMNSSSGGNFALIDSDGAGVSAAQNSILTYSGSIDLSAYGSAAVLLKFTEIYRHYQESYFVGVSNDGGVTWTEFSANPLSEVPVNTNSGNPEIETINVTATIGAGTWSNNVKVRFRYSGAYDWFWGVDDVQLVEALADDIKVSRFWLATDMATTQGLDYFKVPVSQVNFPGLTFGANIINNGSNAQSSVALNAESGAYNATGTSISLATNTADSISVTTPFLLPSAIGNNIVDVKSVLASGDDDDANNSISYTISRDANVYARDNGAYSGAFTNFSSNVGQEVRIGNLMEIFDAINAGYVDVRIANITGTAGATIGAEVYLFDSGANDFIFYTATEERQLTASNLGNFVSLPFTGSGCSLSAGDLILLVAYHYGGSPSVGFGMAQPVQEQTVQGFTTAGAVALSDPNAIMIRLNDLNDLSVNELPSNFGLSIYPNPSSDVVSISFDLATSSDVIIAIEDIQGKTIENIRLNQVNGVYNHNLDVSKFNAGVYFVKMNANGEYSTKRFIKK